MKYLLAEACQNTFILFDCLEGVTADAAFLARAQSCLQRENRDDALILAEKKQHGVTFQARMLVVGADGALGEFCGNGARACAAYLYDKYPLCERFFLTTTHGLHPLLQHCTDTYSIKLPPPRFSCNERFISDEELFRRQYGFTYVEMIEPHLVLTQKMSDAELFALGRELNGRRELFPHGININACHTVADGSLFVKTYERGVQRLTMSCGTGSMSCAALQRKTGVVHVKTPGGSMEIVLQNDGIELIGPASCFR